MESNKKLRLEEMCIQSWSQLTSEERERYFYDTGIIGFVEDAAAVLNINIDELPEADLDDILNKLN